MVSHVPENTSFVDLKYNYENCWTLVICLEKKKKSLKKDPSKLMLVVKLTLLKS